MPRIDLSRRVSMDAALPGKCGQICYKHGSIIPKYQELTPAGLAECEASTVTLPSGLQSLTFGHDFNQRMDRVSLPSGLHSLAFGWSFNQSMENVILPSGLHSLALGHSAGLLTAYTGGCRFLIKSSGQFLESW